MSDKDADAAAVPEIVKSLPKLPEIDTSFPKLPEQEEGQQFIEKRGIPDKK
jgi:hypothetical protein